jgi:two-component system sensor histidine kinase/response regulator
MTANAMKGDRERCLRAGMDDYVGKPVQARRLDEAIARSLRTRAEAPAAIPVGAARAAEPAPVLP